jgi:hypothetical protein
MFLPMKGGIVSMVLPPGMKQFRAKTGWHLTLGRVSL